MLEKLKFYLFPHETATDREILDRETINNIYHASFVVIVYEILSLVVFIISGGNTLGDGWISLVSVVFCIFTCSVSLIIAEKLRIKDSLDKKLANAFKFFVFVLMSIWGGMASYRHYEAGEQMLTFFTVELIFVCFVYFRPIQAILLMVGAYMTFYVLLFFTDRALTINILNYCALMSLSAAAMVIRYNSMIRSARERNALIETKNRWRYLSRHDALTGLLNRASFYEDLPKVTGKNIKVHILDVNNFKQINDTYGHLTGDAVLRELGIRIRGLYPESFCYRFGGDEFLIISEEGRPESMLKDTYSFEVCFEQEKIMVSVSIGVSEGRIAGETGIKQLISDADKNLYEIKARIHNS